MPAKIKNDPTKYLSRASLASYSSHKLVSPIQQRIDNNQHQKREAAGILDNLWYLNLPQTKITSS